MDVLDDDSPTHAGMWHGESEVTVGNAFAFQVDGSFEFACTWYQNAGQDLDCFEQTFMLKEGTYDFIVVGIEEDNRGIIDWTLDGVAIVSGQDWYTAGVPASIRKTDSVSVVGSGRHTLIGTINGRNGGSGGFYMKLARYFFRP
jgi:hypothetical protein